MRKRRCKKFAAIVLAAFGLGVFCPRPGPPLAQTWPPSGPGDGAVPGRRRPRCGRADGGGSSVKTVGPADLRANRGGANGAVGLAALKRSDPSDGYALGSAWGTDQMTVNPWLSPVPVVRSAEGFCAGGVRGAAAGHAGGPIRSLQANHIAELNSAGQAKARRARLRLGRRRQFQPSGDGAVHASNRREDAPRAVQRHRPHGGWASSAARCRSSSTMAATLLPYSE